MSSLAASLDSALKGAAAAQLQFEQDQAALAAAKQPSYYTPRTPGRLHTGVVAAQQNRCVGVGGLGS
jgi:hypothetical protein